VSHKTLDVPQAESPILRSVAGLAPPSDIERAVETLRHLDFPGGGPPNPAFSGRPGRRESGSGPGTPATPRRPSRLTLVERQRLTAERGAERRARANRAAGGGARRWNV